MGARGNSGVILSQIVRGAAEVLGEATTSRRARARVPRRRRRRVPRGAQAGRGDDADGDPRAGRGGRGAAATTAPPSCCARSSRRGDDGVARTREHARRPARRRRRRRGRRGARRDRPRARARRRRRAAAGGAGVEEHGARRRRDPPGAVALPLLHRLRRRGDGLDAGAIEEELERLGDSLLVVGDPSALKVHVHTDDPGAALSLGTRVGAIEGVEIANMHDQTPSARSGCSPRARGRRRRDVRSSRSPPATGNRRLFESLGAPRRRRRPDDEPRHGRHPRGDRGRARRRGDRAPEQLERDHERRAGGRPQLEAGRGSLPTRVAAGGARGDRRVRRVGRRRRRTSRRCARRSQRVATGAVTVASRDTELNGVAVRSGAYLGLADGDAVAGGDELRRGRVGGDRAAAERAARRADAAHGRGRAAARRRCSSASRATHPELELEVHAGGQPHYPLLALGRVRSGPRGRPIRVLLVEDNKVFREALELLLGLRAELEVVGGGRRRRRRRRGRLRPAPDVVLIDYRLPGHRRRRGDAQGPRGAPRRRASSA